MSLVKAYEDSQFIIFSCGDDYVLMNKRKKFKDGHTHIHNFSTAKWLVDLYRHRRIPRKLKNNYLLTSLTRISDDPVYTEKIKSLMEIRKRKAKPYYINVQKGKQKKS